MTDTRREAALRKAYEAFWNCSSYPHASIRAAIDAYELHLREPQPAPAPSGMTEAVRTLARVVEELVNQSGALTCGITALIERQPDIRSVHDALDYAGPTPALPEVPQTAQEIARREIQRIEGGYYGISTAPDILVALHSIAGMEP